MKKRFASFALAATAFVATSANAALVTQWTVGVNAFFDTTSVAWDTSNGANGDRNVSSTQLSWGVSTGPGLSSLTLTNENSSGVVTTNGAAVNNLTITHANNPITGVTLDSVNLISNLTLTPFAPAGAGLPPAQLTFKINFQETPNTPASGNICANGQSNGSGVNVNGCADIFVIDKNALNFAFQYDTDGAGSDPALTYFISFYEITNGLNALPSAACTAAGATSPCLGFMTSEGNTTPATFAAVITSRPIQIPEPGTVALLGLSLLGLAGFRRSKSGV